MKKRKKDLWNNYFLLTIVFLSLLSAFFIFDRITGNVTGVDLKENSFGPSAEEQTCMKSCVSVGCSDGNMTCMQSNSNKCMAKCNVIKPEQTNEEKCVETCSLKGCEQYDFACQEKNQEKCDKECGMVKEPEAKSEEEKCIRECVNKESPGLICKPGEGGEKGNEICQKCAKSCEHLYAGPCLIEMKLEEKKKECQTCEHCYGEPVMGDSGEGYKCIVDVVCKDASSEFGDEPGSGPGIGQEGFVANVGEAIGNVVENIGDFFKGIFGKEEKSENTEKPSSEENSASS